jgi:hypothetical protein
VSIAAVSRTGAVGCTAAASTAAVHTGCIEGAVGDKDGRLRSRGSPPRSAAAVVEGRREAQIMVESSHRSADDCH